MQIDKKWLAAAGQKQTKKTAAFFRRSRPTLTAIFNSQMERKFF
jgi:hypothetical protein